MTLPETADTGAAASPNAPSAQPHLTGRLGSVGIVFMVIAAAAPLTVIGGNMPLAMGLGNGAGAPVGFLIAALVLLVFSIGLRDDDTARTRGRRVLLLRDPRARAAHG